MELSSSNQWSHLFAWVFSFLFSPFSLNPPRPTIRNILYLPKPIFSLGHYIRDVPSYYPDMFRTCLLQIQPRFLPLAVSASLQYKYTCTCRSVDLGHVHGTGICPAFSKHLCIFKYSYIYIYIYIYCIMFYLIFCTFERCYCCETLFLNPPCNSSHIWSNSHQMLTNVS